MKEFINHLYKSKSSLEAKFPQIYCMICSVFILWGFWLRLQAKADIFIKWKRLWTPKPFREKWGFVSAYAAPSLTLARLFSTPPCLAHFLSSTARSHIPKPDVHTPTVTAERDPVILRGWEEFLFPSLPQLSCRLLRCGGFGGDVMGEPGAKRGQGSKTRAGWWESCLFMRHCLYTTRLRGKILARVPERTVMMTLNQEKTTD